ncbi:hypothetical protein [Leadbettera azotonutricia]|uniref:Uncharacterized protein n=1 Tax=Leadbettera azotonutricia (strain ATCC BAA-888 / DSM 13862 / ZAS-9) TaxID=545695 RepID=F5Y9S2_LEAAZ|nr:hypothetical protein [Leadbettera azotonutricia]AEF82319.1 hypothetical protein TREAZ_3198 [Leadbettera azotonutricia ZAS-9]
MEDSRHFLREGPLEDMDLMVDPTKQKLVGAHGDQALGLIY